MPVASDEFRKALGHLAAGVSVITADIAGERKIGMTVTSFTSLSLSPPLVLVCVDHRAWIHGRLPMGHAFAVNLLAEHQEAVSKRFASSVGDQFAEIAHRAGASGAPLLDDAITALECRVTSLLPGGDHTIVVGEVEAVHVAGGQPLLHWRGKYGKIVQ